MTQTIFLDADRYDSPRTLHLALQRMLALPAYYGCNADALHDCLSERSGQQVNLYILSAGTGDTAEALKKCIRVVEDLDGEVKFL